MGLVDAVRSEVDARHVVALLEQRPQVATASTADVENAGAGLEMKVAHQGLNRLPGLRFASVGIQ